MNILLRIGFGMGVGCGRSAGKRVDWNVSEELQSGREAERTWLQLVRCALLHTGVLFRKADQTEKETGGTKVNIQTGDTGGNI